MILSYSNCDPKIHIIHGMNKEGLLAIVAGKHLQQKHLRQSLSETQRSPSFEPGMPAPVFRPDPAYRPRSPKDQ